MRLLVSVEFHSRTASRYFVSFIAANASEAKFLSTVTRAVFVFPFASFVWTTHEYVVGSQVTLSLMIGVGFWTKLKGARGTSGTDAFGWSEIFAKA